MAVFNFGGVQRERQSGKTLYWIIILIVLILAAVIGIVILQLTGTADAQQESSVSVSTSSSLSGSVSPSESAKQSAADSTRTMPDTLSYVYDENPPNEDNFDEDGEWRTVTVCMEGFALDIKVPPFVFVKQNGSEMAFYSYSKNIFGMKIF